MASTQSEGTTPTTWTPAPGDLALNLVAGQAVPCRVVRRWTPADGGAYPGEDYVVEGVGTHEGVGRWVSPRANLRRAR